MGAPTMCNIFCESRGRGHTHLVSCECTKQMSARGKRPRLTDMADAKEGGAPCPTRRHKGETEVEDRKGTSKRVVDEVTCEAFWHERHDADDARGWVCPLGPEALNNSRRCGAICAHDDHRKEAAAVPAVSGRILMTLMKVALRIGELFSSSL